MHTIVVGDLNINHSFPYTLLMEPFRRVQFKVNPWDRIFAHRDDYVIHVELIPVGRECASRQELLSVMTHLLCKKGNYRPLWDFEALTLNHKRRNIQIETPFVSTRWAFGSPVAQIDVGLHYSRQNHELSTIRQYAAAGTPGHLVIAATPITDVDYGMFDGGVLQRDMSDSWEAFRHKE